MRAPIRSIAGWIRLGLLTIGVVAGPAWAADVTIDVKPVWERLVPGANPYPMRVDITNSGADTRGVLRAITLNWEMRYPLELPNGAKKSLVVYPCNVGSTGDVTFEMQTEFERFRETVQVTNDLAGGIAIGMIADAPGLAAFLRRAARNGADPRMGSPETPTVAEDTGVTDVYVQPDAAPDRPAGYSGMGALILGEGSERLSDAQIAAIRTWSLSGGDLIFVGGASAPTLADPRWRDLLPLVPSGVKTVPGAFFGVASEVTLTDGKPTPLSRVDRSPGFILSAWRPHGLGRVVLMTYNPFEKPIDGSEKRREILTRLFSEHSPRGFQAGLISQAIGLGDNYEVQTVVASPGSPTVVRRVASSPEERDPFDAQLPSTPRVFWILAAYFVLVVPVNLIVLRLLKRGEWAWLTTPLISIAFASIFFTAAGDLYQSKLSVATRGLLIAQEGGPAGYVLAKSQVFFPRGGSYNLRFEGIDQIRPVQDAGERFVNPFDRTELFQEMDPIDVGQVVVPDMRVPNLAFREFTFREIVPVATRTGTTAGGGWFQSIGKLNADGSALVGRIVNRSPFTLVGPIVSLGSGRIVTLKEKELAPGKSVDFSVPLNPTAEVIDDPVWISLNDIEDRVLLVGTLVGFRAGPRLGQLVESRSSLRLVYGLNIKRPESRP